MSNTDPTWTDARVKMLKKMWTEGESASRIASKLERGVSRSAVIGKAHRIGLAKRVTPSRNVRLPAARARLPSNGDGKPPRSLADREHAIDDLCLIALDHFAVGWHARDLAQHLGVTAGELAALWHEVQADAAQENAA